ncbi:hypothetical protein PsorP6_017607 [Peronosclerospora sorghi]|uniref:Uncharacterized protein n=1 Tax=Peronosclerospora sorghi TaxID=230839 RepID=A0ACC0WMC8_9STRA|nr:hypothetical protein PsorP6_017607 [Peronosclerospora sorghi]
MASAQQLEVDTKEAERKRKQRDLKRKSRERQNQRTLMELQSTAQALELEYKQLLAQRSVGNEQDERQPSDSVELQSKYAAIRQEMQELRDQMTGLKQKLEEYERFIAVLDGQLMGFQETRTSPQTKSTCD